MIVAYRDAVTGEYVSEEYAKANPATTVKETDPSPDETGTKKKEKVMANEKADPRSEKAKEQQARREAEAAQRQAEKEGAHVDNTLPDPDDQPHVEHH